MHRYKFYNSDSTVVAVSSFGGKLVRATAKCDPKDTFSLEDGKELAAARCNAKIAMKRLKRAERKLNEACQAVWDAEHQYDYMRGYFEKASEEMRAAEQELAAITAKLYV